MYIYLFLCYNVPHSIIVKYHITSVCFIIFLNFPCFVSTAGQLRNLDLIPGKDKKFFSSP